MPTAPEKGIWKIITASSVGTLIEWYDFYIFGSLSTIIAAKFFPSENPTAALLSTLATFAAGFIVRPFGALVFGRLGDLIGRKHTFLLTLVLMGTSTFLIGLVPSYATIGALAPMLVLLLRLIQGLALGGEYGGAATYVAEHAPPDRRGFYTSWIQTTATLGLFLSLGVILVTRNFLGVEEFEKGNGWRYPFLLSIVLVVVSIIIRMKMKESPVFSKLKSEGKTSVNPLKESFGHRLNFKMVLLALFGATMGQGVIWYTSQFYAQSFLLTKCFIDYEQANTIILIALVFATPFFILFGWLSDKMGRRNIMLIGMILGILSYRPIFSQFLKDTDAKEWIKSSPGYKEGKFNMDETYKDTGWTKKWFDFLADGNKVEQVIKKVDTSRNQDTMIYYSTNQWTLKNGIHFNENREDTLFLIGGKTDPSINKKYLAPPVNKGYLAQNIKATTFTDKVLPKHLKWKFIFLIWLMVIYVTMVYGPIAAFLVEMFPTKIRYTSMSLPYHIGNGVFGGLVPFIATLITTIKGATPLSGLWYPIIVAGICFVIGALYLSNKIDKDVTD